MYLGCPTPLLLSESGIIADRPLCEPRSLQVKTSEQSWHQSLIRAFVSQEISPMKYPPPLGLGSTISESLRQQMPNFGWADGSQI